MKTIRRKNEIEKNSMYKNIIDKLNGLAAFEHDDHSIALDAAKLIENICESDKSSVFKDLTIRYLLYMLYRGIYEVPCSNSDYILWLDKMISQFKAQRDNGIKDLIVFLMFTVRKHIIENSNDK